MQGDLSTKTNILKNDILGKNYSLSIAYVSESKSQELNKEYRKKDKPTNVLSFALKKDMGELVLCKRVIEKEASTLGKTAADWRGFLLIHGMLHLKGMKHGAIMEKAEKFYSKKYDKKYLGGNRHGFGDDTSGSRRILKGRQKS